MDLTLITPLIAAIPGLFALVFAGYLALHILKQETGTVRMKEISNAIQKGSKTYLNRQYQTITIFVIVIAGILAVALGVFTALAFIMGVVCSTLAGYIGMNVAIRANVRTAQAARTGLEGAFAIAFRGGTVTGMSVVGLSLLGICLLYYLSGDPHQVIGFGFGASLVGLFARVGGGIFSKGADIGADLVGKVEVGIPEDDPRNPGVIADLVGDNVGDVAGMGSDLFESNAGSIIAAMLVAALVYEKAIYIVFPLMLQGVGILSTIIGTFLVKIKRGSKPGLAINKGIFAAVILVMIATYILTQGIFGRLDFFYAMLVGVIAAILIGLLTQYYTSPDKPPVKQIAKSSQTGPATNIITGLATGMRGTALPIIIICGAVFLAYKLANIYGIAIATIGMQSITGMVVAADSFGPIVDNASGIAEMAGLDKKVREVTDTLDSVGNTTKAVCKGFAICDAVFETIALFLVFMLAAKLSPEAMTIIDPSVIIGLLIGGALAFLFSAFCLQAVETTAFKMIEEIRRQFKEIPGLMEGKAKPDYERCVDISTHTALKNLLAPALLAIGTPLILGFTLGAKAVGGLLMGNIICSLVLAIMMAYSGTAWDNAKKFIEAGNLGGKGTPTHAAAVIGDTIGDPFKDMAGPSLDVLMTVLSTISVLFAPLFLL